MRRGRYKKSRLVDVINFDKSQFAEKELQDKLTLWILRAIIYLGGHKNFIDKNNYIKEDDIAYFLSIGKYVDMDEDDFNRHELINILKNNLIKLDKSRN
jgi:CMP-N-acetylneuraminic acid synthetase